MRVVSYARLTRRANTLIELLMVIAIVAVLAGVILLAINPQKHLGDATDVQRQHDLRMMIDALYQYQIDHDEFPRIHLYETLDEEQRDVCSLTGTNAFDLFYCNFVVSPTPERLPLGPLIPDYLAELPRDPEQPGSTGNCGKDFATISEDCVTGYQLWLDEDGRVHASAPLGGNGEGIELAR